MCSSDLDGIFYFASYRAADLLAKVRFISRFYGEGEQINPGRISEDDDIAQFIAKIERSDAAFQRVMSKAKVRALTNFYETAVRQPAIPGTVMLFTSGWSPPSLWVRSWWPAVVPVYNRSLTGSEK